MKNKSLCLPERFWTQSKTSWCWAKVDRWIFACHISSNYQKIVETDLISAGWHDVIQLDNSKIGKPFARWAVVAFIEGADVEALTREETHKWYNQAAAQ